MLRTLPGPPAIVIAAALPGIAADCDSNGVDDRLDIEAGAPDCNSNGVPDGCELLPSVLVLSPAVVFDIEGRVIACALAAMDSEPRPDAVVLSAAPPALITLPNDGAGNFGAPGEFPLDEAPLAAVIADLEGDGDADAAVLLQDRRLVPIWNDSGTLLRAGRIPADSRPGGVLGADLDADGLHDLVTANTLGTATSLSVSVILQEAGKTFGIARNYEAGKKASSMAAGDADGDGDVDLIVGHEDTLVSVFKNEGNGRLMPREGVRVMSREPVLGVLVADLDGDGSNDLVLTRASHEVEVLFGPLPGSRQTLLEMPNDVREGLIRDLDGDGAPDLVLASRYLPLLWILLGRGQGVFNVRLSTANHEPLLGVSAGDADDDGDMDLAAFSSTQFWLAYSEMAPALEDLDGNGVPDECEMQGFLRGDALADGALDLSDAIAILLALFAGQGEGSCPDALDADDDGSLAIADAITLLLHLFQGGAGLPAPSGECGQDRTGDVLQCPAYTACGG